MNGGAGSITLQWKQAGWREIPAGTSECRMTRIHKTRPDGYQDER